MLGVVSSKYFLVLIMLVVLRVSWKRVGEERVDYYVKFKDFVVESLEMGMRVLVLGDDVGVEGVGIWV